MQKPCELILSRRTSTRYIASLKPDEKPQTFEKAVMPRSWLMGRCHSTNEQNIHDLSYGEESDFMLKVVCKDHEPAFVCGLHNYMSTLHSQILLNLISMSSPLPPTVQYILAILSLRMRSRSMVPPSHQPDNHRNSRSSVRPFP